MKLWLVLWWPDVLHVRLENINIVCACAFGRQCFSLGPWYGLWLVRRWSVFSLGIHHLELLRPHHLEPVKAHSTFLSPSVHFTSLQPPLFLFFTPSRAVCPRLSAVCLSARLLLRLCFSKTKCINIYTISIMQTERTENACKKWLCVCVLGRYSMEKCSTHFYISLIKQ